MLKLSSLFRLINQSLGLKIIGALCLVCLILVPAGSWLSYQYAYANAQSAAETKVHELVAVIEKNAAIAAYLNDSQLGNEIVGGLATVPEIYGVAFTSSSGEKLTQGIGTTSLQKIHTILVTQFSTLPVGELDVFLNSEYINQQAKNKGIELVMWELIFIFSILIALSITYRFLIYHPLQSLVYQIKEIQLGKISSQQKVSISSADEIGFLAHNMNIMIEKIHDSYALDREKNLRIAELEKQFRMIFDNSYAGIALLTSDNKVFLANSAFANIFFEQHHRVYNGEVSVPRAFVEEKDVEHVLDLVRDEKRNVFRDFELKGTQDTWLRALFSLIETNDGRQEQYVEVVVYDISDRALKEKHFAYNASHDPLTGLFNRRGAESRFAEQLKNAQSRQMSFVLILIDLNKFKPVNDNYGHEAGDIVLKEISSRLRSAVSSDDVVVRWGGDEFIISTMLKPDDVLKVMLDNIQRVFQNEIDISSDINVKVGASIGVSTSDACGYDIFALIESADKLMYQVKRERNGGYLITSPVHSASDNER